MTMNAPNSSSNALSVRETTGLVEGNGVFADDTMKDDCVAYSPGLICRPPRPDSKIAKRHLTNVVAASVSRRLGDIAACGVHGDTAPWLQKRIYNMALKSL